WPLSHRERNQSFAISCQCSCTGGTSGSGPAGPRTISGPSEVFRRRRWSERFGTGPGTAAHLLNLTPAVTNSTTQAGESTPAMITQRDQDDPGTRTDSELLDRKSVA